MSTPCSRVLNIGIHKKEPRRTCKACSSNTHEFHSIRKTADPTYLNSESKTFPSHMSSSSELSSRQTRQTREQPGVIQLWGKWLQMPQQPRKWHFISAKNNEMCIMVLSVIKGNQTPKKLKKKKNRKP